MELLLDHYATKADELHATVQRAPLSESARKLLGVAIDAALATPPVGMRARYLDGAIAFRADSRERIASISGVSDKTVYNVRKSLESLGVVEYDEVDFTWTIDFEVLESLSSLDPEDPVDRALIRRSERRMENHSGDRCATKGQSDPVTDPVTEAITDPVTEAITDPVTDPHDHDHEQENEYKPHDHESCHDHEQGDFNFLDWSRSKLTDSVVRELVRQKDREAILALDQEGVRAFGWIDSELARLDRVAMWHHCATSPKVRSPAAVLKARMQDANFKCLKQADSDWAALLLKPPKPAASAIPVRIRSPDEGLPAAARAQLEAATC